MLIDTVIDTGIDMASYYGAVAIVAGIGTFVSLPGIVVVGGVVAIAMGLEWGIREITGYKD
jgi:hypothetical protein